MKTVFVIMPFRDDLRWVYDDLIRPACVAAGASVIRADDLLLHRNVLKDVVEGIVTSDVVVADLTGGNPNVFYELGAAHALMRPVILLTQERDALPFDIRSHRTLSYPPDPAAAAPALDRLTRTLAAALREPVETGTPIAEHFSVPFAARIEQANRRRRPAGRLHLYRSGTKGALIGEGDPSRGLVIDPSYAVRTVHWGSAVGGWGWKGRDAVSARVEGARRFLLQGLPLSPSGDVRGTPYIRTVHDELIYFDLFMWTVSPEGAFQRTEAAGHHSGILEYPLEKLEPLKG
jgi:hypothetical protein